MHSSWKLFVLWRTNSAQTPWTLWQICSSLIWACSDQQPGFQKWPWFETRWISEMRTKALARCKAWAANSDVPLHADLLMALEVDPSCSQLNSVCLQPAAYQMELSQDLLANWARNQYHYLLEQLSRERFNLSDQSRDNCWYMNIWAKRRRMESAGSKFCLKKNP